MRGGLLLGVRLGNRRVDPTKELCASGRGRLLVWMSGRRCTLSIWEVDLCSISVVFYGSFPFLLVFHILIQAG